MANSTPLGSLHFSAADRDAVYRVIAARRDMRHFEPASALDDETLSRLLTAAHQAPSVGLMQPWRFIRITDNSLRQSIADVVEQERKATASAMGKRQDDFLSLKVEGIRECAELLVVAMALDDGTVFGRRTLPREMALSSVACAIQNLWLAARAENLGMGWVSMFDPEALAELLTLPAGSLPMAVLCLGPVQQFYEEPMLEQEGWRNTRPLNELLYENTWTADCERSLLASADSAPRQPNLNTSLHRKPDWRLVPFDEAVTRGEQQ